MRRPWNIFNHPVYSLATSLDGKANMNICTYVMPVSRKPKLYAVSIEHGSKTLHNLLSNKTAVLQLLNAEHMPLVKTLGYRSGHKFDKVQWLEKKDTLSTWENHRVLKGAAAYLLLEKTSSVKAGDHDLFIFKVLKSKTLTESGILMFHDLIENKIILS